MADNVEDWKSLNELIEGLNLQRIRRIWESNEELPSEAEKEALIEAGFLVRQEFKLYEEPPAGLTKWDGAKEGLHAENCSFRGVLLVSKFCVFFWQISLKCLFFARLWSEQ